MSNILIKSLLDCYRIAWIANQLLDLLPFDLLCSVDFKPTYCPLTYCVHLEAIALPMGSPLEDRRGLLELRAVQSLNFLGSTDPLNTKGQRAVGRIGD